MIRFTNTRTGKSTDARDGKDAAHMAKIELDRRSGLELAQRQTHTERAADMAEQARAELQARLSA